MKEGYVYMDCKIRMSNRAMSNLMYAVIITHASISGTYGIGIYEYDRKQNSYNTVEVKIYLHPGRIKEFEQIAEVKLRKPISVTINNPTP